MKKVMNAVGDVLIALILIFAVIITILVVSSSRSEVGIPNLFGYAMLSVQSDSMEGEKGFYKGDLIIIRTLDEKQANELEIGDVVTYLRFADNQGFMETHRIVENNREVNPDYNKYENQIVNGIWINDGSSYYMTKGDNVDDGVDFMQNGNVEYANPQNIIGIWEGKKVSNVGSALDFLQSQKGFLICIVIPLALFFFYELYSFISSVNEKKKQKALADVAASEDDIKQKAVAEFLAQQAAAKEAAAIAEQEKAQQADPTPTVTEAAPEEAPAEEKKPEMSDEEKQRIIDEYLASQQKKETKDE